MPAPISTAAAEHIIWGKTVNAGQTCIAADYAYVHRDVAEKFVELCRNTIAQRFGDDRCGDQKQRLISRA
jgi:acyl-CoA reductase-like NAD-dependent aldehyde dehydrogenase